MSGNTNSNQTCEPASKAFQCSKSKNRRHEEAKKYDGINGMVRNIEALGGYCGREFGRRDGFEKPLKHRTALEQIVQRNTFVLKMGLILH